MMGTRFGIYVVCLALGWTGWKASGETTRGCYGDSLSLSCEPGFRVNVLRDYVGLAEGPGCESTDGVTSCVVTSIPHQSPTRRLCNGKNACSWTVEEIKSCPRDQRETNFQQVDYECLPENQLQDICEEKLWLAYGAYLVSPGYPETFPPNVDCACSARTEAPDGVAHMLTLELNIESGRPCKHWLEFEVDGQKESLCGSTTKRFTGSSIAMNFRSTTHGIKGFLVYAYAEPDYGQLMLSCGPRLPLSAQSRAPSDGRDSMAPDDSVSMSIMRDQSRYRERGSGEDSKSTVDFVHGRDAHLVTDPGSGRRRSSGSKSKDSDGFPDMDSGGGTATADNQGILPDGGGSGAQPPPNFNQEILFSETTPSASPNGNRVRITSGCFGKMIGLSCGAGNIIRILDDFYGVSEDRTCSFSPGDCTRRAEKGLGIAEQYCNTMHSCKNILVTRVMCGTQPTSYQQVAFECIPGNILLNINDKFTGSSAAGYLSSPSFPSLYPKPAEARCLLLPSIPGADVRLQIIHLQLYQSPGCSNSFHVSFGEERQEYCHAGSGRFTAPFINFRYQTDGLHSNSGAWLYFDAMDGSEVIVQCNTPALSNMAGDSAGAKSASDVTTRPTLPVPPTHSRDTPRVQPTARSQFPTVSQERETTIRDSGLSSATINHMKTTTHTSPVPPSGPKEKPNFESDTTRYADSKLGPVSSQRQDIFDKDVGYDEYTGYVDYAEEPEPLEIGLASATDPEKAPESIKLFSTNNDTHLLGDHAAGSRDFRDEIGAHPDTSFLADLFELDKVETPEQINRDLDHEKVMEDDDVIGSPQLEYNNPQPEVPHLASQEQPFLMEDSFEREGTPSSVEEPPPFLEGHPNQEPPSYTDYGGEHRAFGSPWHDLEEDISSHEEAMDHKHFGSLVEHPSGQPNIENVYYDGYQERTDNASMFVPDKSSEEGYAESVQHEDLTDRSSPSVEASETTPFGSGKTIGETDSSTDPASTSRTQHYEFMSPNGGLEAAAEEDDSKLSQQFSSETEIQSKVTVFEATGGANYGPSESYRYNGYQEDTDVQEEYDIQPQTDDYRDGFESPEVQDEDQAEDNTQQKSDSSQPREGPQEPEPPQSMASDNNKLYSPVNYEYMEEPDADIIALREQMERADHAPEDPANAFRNFFEKATEVREQEAVIDRAVAHNSSSTHATESVEITSSGGDGKDNSLLPRNRLGSIQDNSISGVSDESLEPSSKAGDNVSMAPLGRQPEPSSASPKQTPKPTSSATHIRAAIWISMMSLVLLAL